ncbi:MAG: hypothetical protein IV086_06390 [Hyphomonadaceae bacterium]|nr:hypothetical protein [Hyphomonadaceae bacterium]
MRVNGSDRILLQLRAQLDRLQRARGGARSESQPPTGPAPLDAAARTLALARERALSERELGRILVGGLLADEFGAKAASDPKFATLVDAVLDQIETDTESAALLRDAIADVVRTEPRAPEDS